MWSSGHKLRRDDSVCVEVQILSCLLEMIMFQRLIPETNPRECLLEIKHSIGTVSVWSGSRRTLKANLRSRSRFVELYSFLRLDGTG